MLKVKEFWAFILGAGIGFGVPAVAQAPSPADPARVAYQQLLIEANDRIAGLAQQIEKLKKDCPAPAPAPAPAENK